MLNGIIQHKSWHQEAHAQVALHKSQITLGLEENTSNQSISMPRTNTGGPISKQGQAVFRMIGCAIFVDRAMYARRMWKCALSAESRVLRVSPLLRRRKAGGAMSPCAPARRGLEGRGVDGDLRT